MPTRRSTAEAFQILISHTFGDAGSPYMIGLISEALKAAIRGTSNNSTDEFHSLARRDLNATTMATYDRVCDQEYIEQISKCKLINPHFSHLGC